MKRSKPNRGGGESVAAYVSQIGRKKFMSWERQIELGRGIELAGNRYRLLLLQNPYALRRAHAALRKVVLGVSNLRRTLQIPGDRKDSEKTLLSRLPRYVQSLEQALADDRSTFARAMRRSTPKVERAEALKRLTASRRNAARVVARCYLHPRSLEVIFGALRELFDHTAEARAAASTPRNTVAAQALSFQRARLTLKAGEVYDRLARRLELAAVAQRELNRLREELVGGFLPLVVAIAKKYRGRGLAIPDLVGEGDLGLMQAADRYEFRRGTAFSTHATWWVENAIRRALKDTRTIRLPAHVVTDLGAIRRATAVLEHAFAQEPSPAELAGELGWTERKVKELLCCEPRPLSLDYRPSGNESRADSAETLALAVETSVESAESVAEILRLAERFFRTLPERDQLVMNLRFGLRGHPTLGFREISERLGVSKARVGQIFNAAVTALSARLQVAHPDLFPDR